MRNILLDILVLGSLLLLAALTAGSETAIIASNRLKLRKLAAEGSRAAKVVLKILETPERFLGTILVVNNIIDTLIAAFVTIIMVHLVTGEGKGVILATILGAFLIIIFEVASKTLAAKHSERMALTLAGPIKVLIALFTPLVRVLTVITNFMVRVIGGESKGSTSLMTEEEIKFLIKTRAEGDAVHKEKYKMLSKVFDFSEAVVKNVMTPKKDMMSIDIASSFDDMLEKALECGYSRIPVYKNDPDNIIGVINAKDLLSLSCNRELVVLHDILYPATVVSSSKKVSELLREFQKGHTHLAIVVDDQKRVEGIVTLEDLLEEIVGEIEDEYDIRASIHPEKSKNKSALA